MAVDKKISQLTSLAQVDVSASTDVLPIVDTSATETKKITVSALVGAGATAGISGAVLTNGTINSTTIGATTPSTGAFTTLSASGNLTFSSTAQRITGDMSNATIANRLAFQTSTTNGNTDLQIIPNGTSVTSGIRLNNNSDTTNAGYVRMSLNSTEASISVDRNSVSGTYLPLGFNTGGSERMRLDTSGKLLVGLSSSGSTASKLQVTGGTTNATSLATAYSDATVAIVPKSTSGFSMAIASGTSDFPLIQVSANGAAAGDLLLQPYGGNVGIGTASPVAGYRLNVVNDSGNSQQLIRAGTNFNSTIAFGDQDSSTSGQLIYAHNGDYMAFNTNAAERMRIDSSGNVGIGGTAAAYEKISVSGTYPTSSNVSQGFVSKATIPSGATSSFVGYYSVPSTQAAAFTCTSLYHFLAGFGTKGASSAITAQYGFLAGGDLTGATSNFGFYSDIASGSNRWNFYANGTADNYFAGRVFFTSTNATPAQNNVEGMAWTSSKNLQVSCEGDPLYVNRKGSDGALVNFLQDGTAEGNISVAGNTVSYNPFMGSHYTEIVGAIPTLKGTVLESLDELVNGKYSSQDRLPKAKVSDTVGSSAVYGVYFAPDSDPDTNDGILAAALGASWVRIAAGVTVQRGDLLESNGDGCAKVQSDDIIRSKTIGKVTSTTVADTYADGSYIVPCVLYCG